MINYIWFSLLAIGLFYAFITGNVDVVNAEILNSGSKSFSLILEMGPIVILWMGILKIAEKSGLLDAFARMLRPILCKLFPSVKKDSKALGYIASNVAANSLGLGSAATPFGLKAMEELQKDNEDKETASDAMITFLVLNTSGVTIIPTTVIALRMATGSANPSEIIITGLIATICSSVAGLLMDYYMRRKR